MSTPGSPVIPQGGFAHHTRTPSTTSSLSEHQISYKKPVKIKNELNEKRRKALKEYYKLKKQEKELKESQGPKERKDSVHDIDSDGEVTEGHLVKEIDFLNSDFKDLVKDTNTLTSSINLINSSIKNIIYNNYYELIKLNEFLKDLNELDLSKLIIQDEDNKTNKKDALNLLNDTMDNASVKSIKLDGGDGFTKLKSLMSEIEELDKKEIKSNTELSNNKVAENITSYLKIEKKEDISEAKDEIKSNIEKLIAQVKGQEDKETLLRQLEEIQKKL